MVIFMFLYGLNKRNNSFFSFFIIDCAALYLVIPEFYKNVFSSMGNPIIFNSLKLK